MASFWHKHSREPSLLDRLPRILLYLRRWGRAKYGQLRSEIWKLEDKLLAYQARDQDPKIHSEEKAIQHEIIHLQHLEEIHWHQRSRLNWINSGDRNTRFFHLSATIRRNKNRISKLELDNGEITYDLELIADSLIKHFSRAFAEEEVCSLTPNLLDGLHSISVGQNLVLHGVPSCEEIKATMGQIGSLKSPEPDGLPALFHTSGWETVGDEVCLFIQHIFTNAVVPQELKHTNLVLLPKIKGPESPKDYRPISLCNVLYKVVTKILTNRLRPLLNSMIYISVPECFCSGSPDCG